MIFVGVQASHDGNGKGGVNPATLQNTNVQTRIKGMNQAASNPPNTVPAKTRRKYVRPDPFDQILDGELDQVSIRDIHRFIDKAREETSRLAGKPKSQHGSECICLDHIDFALKRELAQITSDSSAYGETIFDRPATWSPPFFSYPEATALHEVVIFAFLAFGMLSMLVLVLITFVMAKFNQAKKAKLARKAAAFDAETTDEVHGADEQGHTQEGFDITRVDIVA